MSFSDELLDAIDNYLSGAPSEFKEQISYGIAPLNRTISFDHYGAIYSLARLYTPVGSDRSYVILSAQDKEPMEISYQAYAAWIRRNVENQ